MRQQTTVRSVRVDDKTWEKAKVVALANETSVSAMIVTFLKKLRVDKEIANVAKTEVRKVNPASTRKSGFGNLENKPTSKFMRVPTAECPHGITKTIPFGTFCCGCGIKLP